MADCGCESRFVLRARQLASLLTTSDLAEAEQRPAKQVADCAKKDADCAKPESLTDPASLPLLLSVDQSACIFINWTIFIVQSSNYNPQELEDPHTTRVKLD